MYKGVFLLFLAMLIVPFVHGQTALTECQVISDSGSYVLANNVSNELTGTCFTIYNNYVTVDCQGYTITDSYYTGTGFYVPDGVVYLTVKNCVINGTLTGTGIMAENGGYNRYVNNTFINEGTGIANLIGHVVEVINNTFINATYSGLTLRSSNTLVKGNHFGTGLPYAIWIDTYDASPSQNNTIYDNIFDSTTILTIFPQFWNVSYTVAKNIGRQSVIGGDIIGGNFWGVCTDNDCNGICDSTIHIADDNDDWLPLSTCRIPTIISANTTMHFISSYNICNGNDLNKIDTYGYCSDTGCSTTNLTAIIACQYACNDRQVPNECNPSPFQAYLMFFAFTGVLIIVIAYFAKKIM